MRLYFAPMEGITGCVYRQAHWSQFGHVDKYFAPFIFTNTNGKIGRPDRLELDPAYNGDCPVVPQLLSNNAQDFIATATSLKRMGYEEINLNLGCPSRTVVSKGRGAGFLGVPEKLQNFLEQIFDGLDMRISIKTRIGMADTEEFDRLLDIYSRFPVAELIIHPRLQTDYYKGVPIWKAFDKALDRIEVPLCYNGDIFIADDFRRMQAKYPQVDSWMMGRGLLANPALAREIAGGRPVSRKELRKFHDAVLEGYRAHMGGHKKIVFLMKEFWSFCKYILSDEDRIAVEKLMHTTCGEDFWHMAEQILDNCTIIEGRGYAPRP